MGLDLTKIEDVMKAIAVEKIELTTPPSAEGSEEGQGDQEGDGQGEGQGEGGDQGEGQGDGEGQGEGQGEGDGEGEDESESDDESEDGEPEPIEIQVEAGAPVYVVRIWTDEHIANQYPDLRYEVEAEYPADATAAAHAAAAEALGTPEFFGTAVYDPTIHKDKPAEVEDVTTDDNHIYTLNMDDFDKSLKDTYGEGLKELLTKENNILKEWKA
jgi:hypothetical protein